MSGINDKIDRNGGGGAQIRQSFSHGRSKVVTVEVKKKRSFNKPNKPIAKKEPLKTSTEVLAQKSGLTSVELENRIRAVQEMAAIQKLEAKKRKDSADVVVSSKIAVVEAEKQEALEREAAHLNEEKRIAEEKRVVEEKRNFNKVAEEKSNTGAKKQEDGKFKDKKNPQSSYNKNSKFEGKKSAFQKKNDDKGSVGKNQNFKNKGSRLSVAQNNMIAESQLSAMQQSTHNKFTVNKKVYKDKNDEDNKKSADSLKRSREELLGRNFERSGKISIYNALDDEDGEIRVKRQKIRKNTQKQSSDDGSKIVREILLPETISVQELANRMAVRAGELIKCLMKLGVMATINQIIDADTAELVVLEMGHKVKRVDDQALESEILNSEASSREECIEPRPPIVTIMGHVDHGKTSLLDALRKTDVALNEAGGITQHIGAYQITLADGRKISFIDTPGHAAFTEMRARGANVTDVVVLVVAADDGVKEQTVEAINHAKAANVPMLVAINKIDKPGADPTRVRNELLSYGIVVESLGGDVIDVEVSAKAGINLDKLEDSILLQAEILELKADKNKPASAVVIESKIEKGLGPVATVLVKNGTLNVGDSFVSGIVYGKVRAIKNDLKMNLSTLTPGTPGEIIGFNVAPVPGDDFIVLSNEQKAKELAQMREHKKREKEWIVKSKGSISDMFAKETSEGKVKVLPVIIKGDVQGSIEAISESLRKLATDEVSVNVLHSGVGGITESDVILAHASNAIILGFNVRANMQARELSGVHNIELKYYSVIYDLIDDVKAILSGLLSPIVSEKVIGSAEVRKVFDISNVGKVAGCMVVSGVIKRSARVRILRDNVVIYTCDVKSIHKGKDDAKEIKEGFECGIALDGYSDIHVNDILEFFEIEKTARTL